MMKRIWVRRCLRRGAVSVQEGWPPTGHHLLLCSWPEFISVGSDPNVDFNAAAGCFPPLNTVGAQKLTGWFSPKLLFLAVWQQMHYCVLAGYLGRLMYATQTHSMAFWSVTVEGAAAGWCHEPGWINCFGPDLSLPVFVSAFHIWCIKEGKWAKCIRWHLVVVLWSVSGCQRCSTLFFKFSLCIVPQEGEKLLMGDETAGRISNYDQWCKKESSMWLQFKS